MKTQKLSLQSIENMLSRDEMKKVVAGCGGSGYGWGYSGGGGVTCTCSNGRSFTIDCSRMTSYQCIEYCATSCRL